MEVLTPIYQKSVTFSDYYFSRVVHDPASNGGATGVDIGQANPKTNLEIGVAILQQLHPGLLSFQQVAGSIVAVDDGSGEATAQFAPGGGDVDVFRESLEVFG